MFAHLVQRILVHGAGTMDNNELVALIMGISPQNASLLGCNQELLQRLARLNHHELQRYPGIGPVAAARLLASLELGRRAQGPPGPERPLVRHSTDAFELLRTVLGHLPHEEFWLLVLDRGNRLMERVRVSMGGYHGTVADPKVIFKTAIDRRASCVVLAHNHPSGQLRPSEEDLHLTRKLHEGGRLLDIAVQDHLIITQAGYYSFADQGQL